MTKQPHNPDDDLRENCWLWGGAMGSRGYGVIRIDGRERRAHRIIYEALVGPVPEGLVLDHLCEVKNCINPDHLEPVTQQVNTLRGSLKNRKPYCRNGHPMIPDNLYYSTGYYGTQQHQCRVCKNQQQKDKRRKARESRLKERVLAAIGNVPADIENYGNELRGAYEERATIRAAIERIWGEL